MSIKDNEDIRPRGRGRPRRRGEESPRSVKRKLDAEIKADKKGHKWGRDKDDWE